MHSSNKQNNLKNDFEIISIKKELGMKTQRKLKKNKNMKNYLN